MKQKGFTLIEMVLVIAIISALATVVLAVLNPLEQFKKTNDARRKSDLYQIQRALETYYDDNGQYPPSSADFQIENCSFQSESCDKIVSWGSAWQPYMNILPKDPASPSKSYAYYAPTSGNGQTYYLYASLDRGADDPNVCNGGDACNSLSTNGISNTACGDVCSFGVSSPNVSP